jgi:hypothetical protein
MTRSGLYVYILYTSYTQFRSSNCSGLISVWMKCEFNLLFFYYFRSFTILLCKFFFLLVYLFLVMYNM